MLDVSNFGKMIVLVGIVLVVLGAVVMLAGKWPGPESGWGWIGRLPGDIFHQTRKRFVLLSTHDQPSYQHRRKRDSVCSDEALTLHEIVEPNFSARAPTSVPSALSYSSKFRI